MNEASYTRLLEKVLKKSGTIKPDIPARILEQGAEEIIKLYGKAYSKIFEELLYRLIEEFGVINNPSYQSQLALLKLIEDRMSELNREVTEQMTKSLKDSYDLGGAFHELATKTVNRLKDTQGAVPYSQLTTYKTDQIIKDTMEDLLFVTQHTSKELKKVVRSTFMRNLQFHAVQGENAGEIKKIIKNQLSKDFMKKELTTKGFVGIVDKSGRKWNLKTYVDMAVTTKLNQAYTEGVKDRAIATGYDLAVIPEKGAVDSCSRFEGMIISMTGATSGYMTYEQLKATGLIFHPRCKHSPYPIGSAELLPEEDLKFHRKQERALKEYVRQKRIKK